LIPTADWRRYSWLWTQAGLRLVSARPGLVIFVDEMTRAG